MNEDKNDLQPQCCRICYDDSFDDEIIHPCNCKGTLSTIHRSCFKTLVAYEQSSICNICKSNYSGITISAGNSFNDFCKEERLGIIWELQMCFSFTIESIVNYSAYAYLWNRSFDLYTLCAALFYYRTAINVTKANEIPFVLYNRYVFWRKSNPKFKIDVE